MAAMRVGRNSDVQLGVGRVSFSGLVTELKKEDPCEGGRLLGVNWELTE